MIINEILWFDKFNKSKLGPCPSFDEGLQDTWNIIRDAPEGYETENIPFDLPTRVFRKDKDKSEYIFAFASNNQIPIMYLGLKQYYNGFQIDNVRVEPSVRGNHYGMKLYLTIVDYYHKPIYSGSQQTTASNNAIWKKLIELHPDQVVGFDQLTKKDLKLKVTDRGPTVKANEPIYISLKSPKYTFNYTRGMARRTRLLKLLPK